MGDAPRLTLWGIESFLAVAEEGAISAAARRLGVSPSAVSQQLSGIEAALGAVLVDRASRPMGLTPAGAMFRRHAQAILNAEAEARADLAVADLSLSMTLRLGMIEDFDAEVTPALLTTLARELSGCRFLLETGASHRLLDQLESRALDMVVTADQEAHEEGWREVHPLMVEPFVAVYPKARREGLPLIQYTARHLMGRQIAAHLAREGQRPAHRFELDSYSAILAMVAGGEGWTILTPLALHHAARFRAGVEVAPLPFAPLARSLSLSARSGVLREIPAQVAGHLRHLVAEKVIGPALKDWPWMTALRVKGAAG
ncbi:LysR family transcriptional regulator [Stagnihabitans tardus]|uniref:LysR family transcriptional regulator n=1 Tax=Stagnihabitans tardus TaxID=2699202 RepID=A0AAE5BXK1_9RHOB|nr:LysR family transcriptional regulator [Stagnihabitans tardus]NBZ89433.1 LysR family transcriptional regulator [Stagnihabitans tardus]